MGDEKQLQTETQVVTFVMQLEIRKKFENLWTYCNTDGAIVVKIVQKSEKKQLEENSCKELNNALIVKMKGFSKIIEHISESEKPIVGHNCLLDLIKLYNQFINPVPVKYQDFKSEIHKLFPSVYDTKNICYNVQKKISKVHPDLEHVFSSSNLNDLHDTLVARDDKYNLMWSPNIVHAEGCSDYQTNSSPHEAGYDAYLAGFCFIRTCHLAATISYLDIKRMRVLSFHELLTVVKDHKVGRCDCKNIINFTCFRTTSTWLELLRIISTWMEMNQQALDHLVCMLPVNLHPSTAQL